MKFPYTLKLEKRTDDVPKWLPAATAFGSVIVAFIISGIILKFIGGEPLRVLKFFFSATFGSWGVFSDTLVKATPLIMVGLACAVAFRMKLWNIGAEGQFYMGAFFSSLVVLIPIVPLNSTPKFVVIGLMIVMGMIGGAIWGFIPGYLKA
ncbi:MAG: ABC transporter permease, partial [Chloroflexi bacterium]|nr:ABC transporter permease [Chloroflexota bacterium]